MEKREIIIAGAGASGMMAAITAARCGAKVTLLEKMERPGRKIRITGKGRCNITNTKSWEEFSSHIHPNSRFLKHAFHAFSNTDTIKFFEEIGLKTVTERGDRVFPESGKATDVTDALVNELNRLGVRLICNVAVTGVNLLDGTVKSISVIKNGREEIIGGDAFIIATGGLTYPMTGSTGDGYKIASKCGHTIAECFPSLTALMPVGYNRSLDGLQVKNCEITLFIGKDSVQREMGDLDFTGNGIEGSIGYKISRKAVKAIKSGNKCRVSIDLKPAVSKDELEARVERELKNTQISNTADLLRKFLPKQAVIPFIEMNQIENNIGRLLLKNGVTTIVNALKEWRMNIESYTSYERAVVTAGGINLDEIVPKNMKSRMISNLWFAGEIIDLDGDTGGYNLQIAFSTGFLAGKSASQL